MDTLKRLTPERLKNIVYSISKSKSPNCPDVSKIFLRAAFLIDWIRFQRVIGARIDANSWIVDTNSIVNADRNYKETVERLQYYRDVKDSEGTEDISQPDPLKSLKKFRDFRDELRTYLRTKRGVANVPLTYVIRDDMAVTDADRRKTVGKGPTDTYSNWDDYSIRCTVHEDTHWESDNASVWRIIGKLVRDGLGWNFIRSYKKVGDGDGRGAYKSLKAQAFQVTNVRMLCNKAHHTKKKYSGPARNWNYEKYVLAWLENLKTLNEFEDAPKQERIVSDFCSGISDPWLEPSLSVVLSKGSQYVDDFEKIHRYLNQMLAVSENREAKRGKS